MPIPVLHVNYPTAIHKQAVQTAIAHFSQCPEVEAIILIGSGARGKSVGDLDLHLLVQPDISPQLRTTLEQQWTTMYETGRVFKQLRQLGTFSRIDFDINDGHFIPGYHGWTSGPDEFELEVGNIVAYSVPLWQRSDYYEQLRERWLPYYDETLRQQRLKMVCMYCNNNLDHIPFFVGRELYFQAFNRLYDAFREFLQALFIARHTYPIAYDKWIREQIEEMLELPALYKQLVTILEISHFESGEIAHKGTLLRQLLAQYVVGA